MLIAINVAGGLHTLTKPAYLAAFFVLFVAGTVASRGDLESIGKGLMVGGWTLFTLTTPSAQFPSVLHFLGPLVAGAGVVIHAISRPPSAIKYTDEAVAYPSRFLFIYFAFAILGCIASPYGPKNLLHWFEGVLILASAFYGVSARLGAPLLVGTFVASFTNVVLTLQSGLPRASGSADAPARLSGYMQPNHLAFAACMVIIGVVWGFSRYPRFRAPMIGAVLISSYVLVESRSRTSLIALVAALTISWLAELETTKRGAMVVRSLVGLLVLSPVLIPLVIPWFNRGGGQSSSLTSLTGRTSFWPIVLHMINERPIIGWGVNAVGSPPVADKFQAVTAGAIQAHNAFFEAALIGGIPGVIFWAGALFGTLIGSFRLPRGTPYRTFVLASTILLAFESLTESNPAWYGDMFLIVSMCVALYGDTRRTLRESRGPAFTATLPELSVRYVTA